MLEMLDLGIDKTIAFRTDGKVTAEDMNQVLGALEDAIAQHGEVYTYQQIDSLGGVEFEAVVEKMKYLVDHGIGGIKRIAIVTDKAWMHKIVALEDRIFRSIDMRAFALDERDAAIAFLSE